MFDANLVGQTQGNQRVVIGGRISRQHCAEERTSSAWKAPTSDRMYLKTFSVSPPPSLTCNPTVRCLPAKSSATNLKDRMPTNLFNGRVSLNWKSLLLSVSTDINDSENRLLTVVGNQICDVQIRRFDQRPRTVEPDNFLPNVDSLCTMNRT